MNKLDKIIKESVTKVLSKEQNKTNTLEESIRKMVREALDEIGGINDNIPYGNWMVDYDERDYPNIFGDDDNEEEDFNETEVEDTEDDIHEEKSSKKKEGLDYTHYAVNKQTGKIVNGWDNNCGQ